MAPYLYLAFAILTEVAATSALKYADGFTRLLPSIIVVACYGSSFYLLSLALRTLQVGFTYPVWCGVGIVLISIIGVFFLGEEVDIGGIFGMGLIIAGVVVMSVFSKMGNA
ncbi:MAG: multidrug efflux SMR transporter [Pseudomonadota bacterium]